MGSASPENPPAKAKGGCQDHLFHLAHTPGVPLLGIQHAAVKDAIRTWWKARPDKSVSLRVRLPRIGVPDCHEIADVMADELGGTCAVHPYGPDIGNVIEITPREGTP